MGDNVVPKSQPTEELKTTTSATIEELKKNNTLLVLAGLLIVFLLIIVVYLFRQNNQLKQEDDKIVPITSPTVDSEHKIVGSYVTYDCQISIDLSTGQTVFINTGYFDLGTQSAKKCYQFITNQPSPSGKYVVFRDISGGIDSKLSLFSIEDLKTYTVGNWGTSNLLEFVWAGDDRLVVLYGWLLEPESHYLSYYDLTDWNLLEFDEYDGLINASIDLQLPGSEKGFELIRIKDEKVVLRTEGELVEVELP